MKTLTFITIICAISFASLSHAQYILTLQCNQMDSYIGKTFKVRVTEIGTGYEVGRKTITTVETTTFTIELYVLLQNKSYQVDFYADENWNGRYDAPPDDHAWRRMIDNATGPVTINFTNDLNYTDISFPDDLPFGTYNAVWGGHWKNLTFGSTDSIEGTFNLRCDSVLASFSTKGVFGNPAPVMFDFADTVSSDLDLVTDTINYSPGAPWTGEVYIINGEIHGNLVSAGLELAFTGTLGLQQLICLYTVANGGTVFANGYFYLRELEVIYLFPPLTLELSGMPVSCHGGSDGSVWSTVVGGTGSYEYAWLETGATTPHIEGVWADTFTLTVTDELGCSIEDSYILDDHSPLSIDVLNVTDESCPGACDAIIEVAVSGGALPYTYEIEGEGCAGVHTLIVTDALGCMDSIEVIIGTASNLQIFDIDITDATNGMSNGAIEVYASGGIPPLSYSIDGASFQFSNLFVGLPPGQYEVCTKDGNDCLVCESSIVVQNTTAVHHLVSNVDWFPNPASAYIHVNSDIPLTVVIKDFQGHQVKWIESVKDQNIDLDDIPPGMYMIIFSDGIQTNAQKLIIH